MSGEEVQLKIIVGNPEQESERYLNKITQNLRSQISQLNLQVDLEKGDESQGSKGEPFTIGTLLVAAFSSGAIKALITRVGNWIRHNKHDIEIVIKKTPEGIEEKRVKITQANLSSKEIKDLFGSLADQLKE